MLIVDAGVARNEAALDQYFSSGWRSLTAFLVERMDPAKVRTFEARPDVAYKNHALVPSEEMRRDFAAAKTRLLEHACALAAAERLTYLEFGVRAGVSMRLVTKAIPSPGARFYGFDTFTGLPDGWVSAYGNRGGQIGKIRAAGEMAVDQLPDIADRRVILVKGLFQDTLPTVLPNLGGERLFVNIDCDTYTGALYALAMLHPYLKTGDVVYFDEFVDEMNEFAAFNDYVRSFYMKSRFRLMARAFDGFLFTVVD